MSTAPQQQMQPITVIQVDMEKLAELIAGKLALEQLQPLRNEIAAEMGKLKTEVAVVKTRLNYISLGWLGAVVMFIFAVIKIASLKP